MNYIELLMIFRFRKLGKIAFSLLLPLCLFCSCSDTKETVWEGGIDIAEDTVSFWSMLGETVQGVLVIEEDIDLKNRKCCLPKDVTLSFQGGVVKNGTLVGDGTKIDSHGVCFDRVRILGSWNVPEISTSMFKDLGYYNSLKDVMALANPGVWNRIEIEPGDYQVTAQQSGDACLSVCGKTELAMDGTIRLVPNDFAGYDIIRVEGDSVVITGSGTIVGDKHTHTGTEGEWGMGVRLNHAHNVHVSGLTFKDCWGDCIYVGGKSTDVLIEGCHLDHGRRQGVSITSADGVAIRNCTITNVGGTNPEYAIDVEPNSGDIIDHVTIENITVRDCKGGFVVYGRANDARVGTVTIRNCNVSADNKITVAADKCDTLIIENCNITQHNTWGCVACTEVGHVEIMNNTLYYDKGIMAILKDWARPKFGKKRVRVMEIEDCGTNFIERNKEVKL